MHEGPRYLPVLARKPDVDQAALDAVVDRAFGTTVPVSCQRTPDGLRTQVYRLRRDRETFYLRLAEEADENLEAEAELFRQLRQLGVRVPEPVHVEPFDPALGRSVLITTEIHGVPLEQVSVRSGATTALQEAGADLARLNQHPVKGFGWIQRRGPGPLQAQLDTYGSFVIDGLPPRHTWPGPLATAFSTETLDAIERLVEQEIARPVPAATLAHGDLTLAHIFVQRGAYTGLIDFGEIRGTDSLFDLGFFHLNAPEVLGVPLLPVLLEGYQRVQPLPPDHLESIRRSAVVHGLPELCGWLAPERGIPRDHPVVAARVSRIAELAAQPG
ncbi:aminoglycoside phosphotransferase family protein [Actinopolymorpha sp. B17G11]|uniref:phosphotransferase family protein n=1 Tax=Actinopolymorpha sp. B17G11 TaxID=3160861 RepID=UPI0032E39899